MTIRPRGRGTRAGGRGQAMVEFAIALVPLLLLLFGVLDLGRGIYLYNAVSEATREIARVTIVHPYEACCTLGSSDEAQAVIDAQRRVIPGLTESDVVISCVDLSDQTVEPESCIPSSDFPVFVKVLVRVAWSPASPLLYPIGVHEVSSISRMELQ